MGLDAGIFNEINGSQSVLRNNVYLQSLRGWIYVLFLYYLHYSNLSVRAKELTCTPIRTVLNSMNKYRRTAVLHECAWKGLNAFSSRLCPGSYTLLNCSHKKKDTK